MWMVLLILMGLYFLLGIVSHFCNIYKFFEEKEKIEQNKTNYKPNNYKSSDYNPNKCKLEE